MTSPFKILQEQLGREITQETPIRITPGPFEVSPAVQRAALSGVVGHRTDAFRSILRANASMLLQAFQIDQVDKFFSVVIPGTGTAAMEAMVGGIAPQHRPLVLVNGRFSRRLADMSMIHNPQTVVCDFGIGATIDPERISNILANDPTITSVFFGLQDTREAILNDYRELSRVVKRHKRLLCVDGISAMVCEDIRPEDLEFDLFVESSGKGIRALPGLGVVCGRLEIFEDVISRSSQSYYLNLFDHFQIQRNRAETLFADPVNLHFAMHQALTELLGEGVEKRRRAIQQRTQLVRNQLSSLGARFLRPLRDMPHSVTSVLLEGDIEFGDFQGRLRERGFLVYPGSSIHPNCFQIGTAGFLSDEILLTAIKAVHDCLHA